MPVCQHALRARRFLVFHPARLFPDLAFRCYSTAGYAPFVSRAFLFLAGLASPFCAVAHCVLFAQPVCLAGRGFAAPTVCTRTFALRSNNAADSAHRGMHRMLAHRVSRIARVRLAPLLDRPLFCLGVYLIVTPGYHWTSLPLDTRSLVSLCALRVASLRRLPHAMVIALRTHNPVSALAVALSRVPLRSGTRAPCSSCVISRRVPRVWRRLVLPVNGRTPTTHRLDIFWFRYTASLPALDSGRFHITRLRVFGCDVWIIARCPDSPVCSLASFCVTPVCCSPLRIKPHQRVNTSPAHTFAAAVTPLDAHSAVRGCRCGRLLAQLCTITPTRCC